MHFHPCCEQRSEYLWVFSDAALSKIRIDSGAGKVADGLRGLTIVRSIATCDWLRPEVMTMSIAFGMVRASIWERVFNNRGTTTVAKKLIECEL